jgi:hypothetical protein
MKRLLENAGVVAGKMIISVSIAPYLVSVLIGSPFHVHYGVLFGVLILIPGISIFLYSKKKHQRLLQFIENGYSCATRNSHMLPCRFFKIKGFILFYIGCIYQNQEGVTCYAKSDLLYIKKSVKMIFTDNSVLIPHINYCATVYINRNAPNDFHVAVYAELA